MLEHYLVQGHVGAWGRCRPCKEQIGRVPDAVRWILPGLPRGLRGVDGGLPSTIDLRWLDTILLRAWHGGLGRPTSAPVGELKVHLHEEGNGHDPEASPLACPHCRESLGPLIGRLAAGGRADAGTVARITRSQTNLGNAMIDDLRGDRAADGFVSKPALVPPTLVQAVVALAPALAPFTPAVAVDLIRRLTWWVADPHNGDATAGVPWEAIGAKLPTADCVELPAARAAGLEGHEAEALWDLLDSQLTGTVDGLLWRRVGQYLGGRPTPVVAAALGRLDLTRKVSVRAARSATLAALKDQLSRGRAGAIGLEIDESSLLAHPDFGAVVDDVLRWANRFRAAMPGGAD